MADANRRDDSQAVGNYRGAKPGDLPVEQPVLFDFVVNETTAERLGITIWLTVRVQTTEVIK